MTLSRTGDSRLDLTITIAGAPDAVPDQLTVVDQFRFAGSAFGPYTGPVIESIVFADNTVWMGEQIWQQLFTATSGADVLVDNLSTDQTLDGGAGNDWLEGRDGNDTYVFGRGYGTDTILDDSSFGDSRAQAAEEEPPATTDVVEFGADIAPEDLELSRGGDNFNDLIIRIIGTDDKLVIKGQLEPDEDPSTVSGPSWNGIEEFHFADDTVWNRAQIADLDLPRDLTGPNLIVGAYGGDTLDGGDGNDTLLGGGYDDVYLFGRGYAEDSITDAGGEADRVQFAADVEPNALAFSRTGDGGSDLLIEVDGLERLTLTVTGQFGSEDNRIESFRFADGTELAWQDVQQQILLQGRSNGADSIAGFATNDTIDGGAGSDTLRGSAGDDGLLGGTGRDVAVFAGKQSDYDITVDGTTVTVHDLAPAAAGDDGTDTLVSVEQLRFEGDGSVLDVLPANHAPVATTDSGTTAEDTSVTFSHGDLLSNDTDADSNPLTIQQAGNAVGGVAWIDSAGDVVFSPNANFNGSGSFTYTVDDGEGGQANGTVNVTVTPLNDAPVAAKDGYTVDEDKTLTVAAGTGVLANDSDVDGDTLSATLVDDATHGDLTLNGDGSFSYTPDADFNGKDSFSYTASDGHGGTATATVALTVGPVNDAPEATDDDDLTTPEDTALSIAPADLLANDSDPDDDELFVTGIGNAVGGTLAVAEGKIVFTPDADYNGAASFDYTIADGNGGTSTATVNLTVTAVNDAPVAVDASVEASVDTAAEGDLTATDVDNNAAQLTFALEDGPAHGSVEIDADGRPIPDIRVRTASPSG
jgi:hypothetical protein